MEFLYFLAKLRNPVLDAIMLFITQFGEETAFLVAALVVFWCVDKRRGYFVLCVGLLGTIVNQVMKLICRVPRPWVLDENFTIVEQAREAATGYSFPSGHSQSAVGTFGAVACCVKNRVVKGICIAVAVLVPLSRMYLGVHTPQDVLVGSAMALALIFLLRPVMLGCDGKYLLWVFAALAAASVAFLAYVELYPFPADMDAHNLQSGVKNAYTMLGCTAGLLIGYPLEAKYIRFSAKAVWWAQILKVALGLAAVLLVKEGLRTPLEAVFAGHMAARAVRYFLIVIVAGVIWPMSFRFFGKLGQNKCRGR